MSMEQHLRDVLAEQAERCFVPPPDVNAMLAGGTTRRRRSRRRITLAAAAAVVLATVSGVAAWNTQMENRSGGVTDQPADSDCLPPGQVPSYSATTTERPDFIGGPVVNPQAEGRACRVVLRKYFHSRLGSHTGKVWLLSDGRVIYWTDGTDGLVEQRLTAEGVERVRVMAVDLVTDVRPTCREPRDPSLRRMLPSCQDRWSASTISYQGRTHWISTKIDVDAETYLSDYSELADRLFDLSWLPDSAFVSQEPRPYTPNWWATCYGGRYPVDGETWTGDYPVDRQQVLDRLPDDAAAVLRDKDTTTVPIRWGDDNGLPGETTQFCTIVSATEQQVISSDLDYRGSEEIPIPLGRIGDLPAELGFKPLLPDGETPCFCA
jgi:hypothetical protein